MADEVNYETHLLSIDQALSVLQGSIQYTIMLKAYVLWTDTVKFQAGDEYKVYITDLKAEYARITAASSAPADGDATGDESVVSQDLAALDANDWGWEDSGVARA